MKLQLTLLVTLGSFLLSPAVTQAESDVAAASPKDIADSDHSATSNAAIYTSQQIFGKLDADHDASLTMKDFIPIDQDRNGEISMSEFSAAVGSGGVGSSSSMGEDETGGFMKGFSSSTAMIIATEIGDKTFFIAAVLSMRNSRLFVFLGAILALSCMTVLSTMMGLILPSVLPRQYTHIIGGMLFLYFGIKLIYDSRSMSDKVSDELEEVEEELLHTNTTNKKHDGHDEEGQDGGAGASAGSPAVPPGNQSSSNENGEYNVFFQSFLLTFVAEWGDRSQIATIALAAAKDPYGVTFGACFGHSLCTGMAVVGGRMLASKISERTVSFWGGIIFLAFGIHALFFDV